MIESDRYKTSNIEYLDVNIAADRTIRNIYDVNTTGRAAVGPSQSPINILNICVSFDVYKDMMRLLAN